MAYGNNVGYYWDVQVPFSSCIQSSEVRIYSLNFLTEPGYDILTIDDEDFSGRSKIDKQVGSSFSVSFRSDVDQPSGPLDTYNWSSGSGYGFRLLWECNSNHCPCHVFYGITPWTTGYFYKEGIANGRAYFANLDQTYVMWYGHNNDWMFDEMGHLQYLMETQDLGDAESIGNTDTVVLMSGSNGLGCPTAVENWTAGIGTQAGFEKQQQYLRCRCWNQRTSRALTIETDALEIVDFGQRQRKIH